MSKVEHLFEKLLKYTQTDIYPYHMPGHKRKGFGMLPEKLYKIDITEIEGFDNLHQPEDVLQSLQQEAAGLYGAEESFYLVNGSTCGILSAVSSALPAGGHILMARNCHKSAYHAAYLRGLSVTYLYPAYLGEYDIYDAIEPRQIRRALAREPDIGAVLIVSPTYEGRISDIRAIAEIVHEKGIPLIVDEAHGAHLGLWESFPKNSCQLGADLVIHSVHKTLPALTQSALLHVGGELIDRERLRRFLRIYQSSSPSYLLMAGIDSALQYVKQQGQEIFGRFRERYEKMLSELAVCRHLKSLPDLRGKQDIGKLLISVKRTKLNGKQLYDILLKEFHLQTEMASASFVLAMFTVNDGEEAYRRMAEALLAIDGRLEEAADGSARGGMEGMRRGEMESAACKPAESGHQTDAIPLALAWDMPVELADLTESAGRYIGEFINLYPPGVPLLVPGERITGELCRNIADFVEQGLEVQGIQLQKGGNGLCEKALVPVICRTGNETETPIGIHIINRKGRLQV